MTIHFCWFCKVCRDEGAPKRLYVTTSKWGMYIGWREFTIRRWKRAVGTR